SSHRLAPVLCRWQVPDPGPRLIADRARTSEQSMKFKTLSVLALAATVAVAGAWKAASAHEPLPKLHVVKSASCGCCQAWIDYMKAEGFEVTVENRDVFTELKRSNGVTQELQSCHTAFVDGIVV